MSLAIRPKSVQTFSEDWKLALNESPFRFINHQISYAVFRNCSIQDLGRLASVCKAIRFFSETQEVWRDKHLERWSISWRWVGNMPDNWKTRTQRLFELMVENRFNLSLSDMFWEQGFVNEARLEAKNQAIASEIQGNMPWSYRAKKAGMGLAFSRDLIEAPTANKNKKEHEKIELICSEMLGLINQREYKKLFSLYLESREEFIRASTLKGWWICQVLIRLHKAKKIDYPVPEGKEIHLPKGPGEGSSNLFFSYFLGLNRFWLDQGNMLLTLPTLNCLRQLLNRTVDLKGIIRREARKEMIYQMELDYDRLYLAQHAMSPRDLDNFAIDRMIVYLKAGFLDRAKQLLSLIVIENKDPVRWNELLGEAYLGSKVQGKGYSQSAYDVFSKALDLLPRHNHRKRGYFERKLLQASIFILIEQKDPSIAKVLERFNTNYPDFQQILDQLSINEITVMLKVIIKHEAVLLYPNFLQYLKSIQIERLKTPISEKIDLCVRQLQLHVLQKDFKGAATRWLDLYYLERKRENLSKFCIANELCVASEWLYKLVDRDKLIAQELIELDPKNPYSRLALAYHYYLEDDLSQVFEIVKEIAKLVERDDLDWLAEISQTNFEAFIIYSYVYSDEGSLENYFVNYLDDRFSKKEDEIYHNFAVRLYFEGHFEAALENLELVTKRDNQTKTRDNQTKTQILKYLIAEKIGDEEMMDEAFNRVWLLTNKVLRVDDREFFQDDLFIF